MKQLQSILTDLENREITKHQAYDLILVLFCDNKSTCNNFHSDPFVNEYKCLNCGKIKSEHLKYKRDAT